MKSAFDLIQQIAGTHKKDIPTLLFCTVKRVDEEARTCTVVPVTGDSNSEIEDVKLSPEPNDGFILLPAIDSTVIINVSVFGDAYIIMYSDIYQAEFIVNETKLKISDGAIKLNDGYFGGLVKIDELVNKINNLESSLNDLKQLFTSWTPVPNDGGAALKAIISTWSAQLIVETEKTELENNKVTHG